MMFFYDDDGDYDDGDYDDGDYDDDDDDDDDDIDSGYFLPYFFHDRMLNSDNNYFLLISEIKSMVCMFLQYYSKGIIMIITIIIIIMCTTSLLSSE